MVLLIYMNAEQCCSGTERVAARLVHMVHSSQASCTAEWQGNRCMNVSHLLGIDLAVDDDPSPTTQLSARWNVDKDRLFVPPQVLHNKGPSLHTNTRE